MRERPILFSAPMVRAILDGQKTQTRRLVKFPPGAAACDHRLCPSRWVGNEDGYHCAICGAGIRLARSKSGVAGLRCPYGAPGDRLWVREASRAEELALTGQDGVRYLADDAFRPIENTPEAAMKWLDMFCYGQSTPGDGVRIGKGVPSIHMPRWASRILLEIVSVRVERLNDCSEADARADGAEYGYGEGATISYRRMYELLWEHINGAGSWDANPFVWVVEFKRVQP